MSGHHTSGGSSNWKLWILVGVLVVVIIALAFLCIHFVLGGGAPAASAPESAANISAQIAAQDANGKDVTKYLAITEGTMAPETDDPNARFLLVDIGWDGKKDPAFPMIVTISDQSFTNDDGLAVYHYAGGQWNLLGTYLIKNNAVSFQADSFSPFAFQVISANPPAAIVTTTPEPTAEPTATPEPTAEPTPTPEPVDYGKYDDEQEGIFLQMDEFKKGRDYVIALIDTENEVEVPEEDGVTFFGAEEDEKVYNAQILTHYDEDELRLVEAQVAETKDGQYYILTPVVEGMLWNTEKRESAYGAYRFSLKNNGKYLNLDNPNEFVVLDEDSGRTRWLYEEIERDGEDVYTLTYRANLDRFFVKTMEMAAAEAEDSEDEEATEAEETLTITATATRKESMILHIFAIDTGEVETEVVSGTLVLTSTPAANAGLDATPVPTNTPNNSGGSNLPQPVTPTAVPTTKPTAVPTAQPTAIPTAAPTDPPAATDPPPVVTDKPINTGSGTNTGGGGNSGGGSQTGSGTNT